MSKIKIYAAKQAKALKNTKVPFKDEVKQQTLAPSVTLEPTHGFAQDLFVERDSEAMSDQYVPRNEKKNTKNTSVHLNISQHNDSFMGPGVIFMDSKYRIPKNHPQGKEIAADDDGFTAAVNATLTATNGNQQLVLDEQFRILTERGAWLKPEREMRDMARNDVNDLSLSYNQRTQIAKNTDVFTSIGMGMQTIGPQGGYAIQRGFHENFTPTARTVNLQKEYTSSDLHLSPVLLAGAKIEHHLLDNLDVSITAKSFIPLHKGLGAASIGMQIDHQFNHKIDFTVGLEAVATLNQNKDLKFIKHNGARIGAFAEIEAQIHNNISVVAKVRDGGAENEASYSIGASFSFGKG